MGSSGHNPLVDAATKALRDLSDRGKPMRRVVRAFKLESALHRFKAQPGPLALLPVAVEWVAAAGFDVLDVGLNYLASLAREMGEALGDDTLRKRADVLMAATDDAFCDEVASKAATYAHDAFPHGGFGSKKNREGARILETIQRRIESPEWRSAYEQSLAISEAAASELAAPIAEILFVTLYSCPLAKRELPLLSLPPEKRTVYMNGRLAWIDSQARERMRNAIAETLQQDKVQAKPIAIAAFKSLGCTDARARLFFPR